MWTFDIVHAHGAILYPAVATDIEKLVLGLSRTELHSSLDRRSAHCWPILADHMGDIGCTVARDQYSWPVISGQMKAASCLH
jgi:hypothetical protein